MSDILEKVDNGTFVEFPQVKGPVELFSLTYVAYENHEPTMLIKEGARYPSGEDMHFAQNRIWKLYTKDRNAIALVQTKKEIKE